MADKLAIGSEVPKATVTHMRKSMDYPFEYVKELQSDFDYSKIQFSNEYYDVLGIER